MKLSCTVLVLLYSSETTIYLIGSWDHLLELFKYLEKFILKMNVVLSDDNIGFRELMKILLVALDRKREQNDRGGAKVANFVSPS